MSKSKQRKGMPVQTPLKENTAPFAEKFDAPLPDPVEDEPVEVTESHFDDVKDDAGPEVKPAMPLNEKLARIKSDARTISAILDSATSLGGVASLSAVDLIRAKAALERINDIIDEP